MLRFFHIIKFNLFSRPDELKVAYLKIEGLKSDSSLLVINDAVRKKPGIVSVSVDLASKVAQKLDDRTATFARCTCRQTATQTLHTPI